MVIYEVYYQDVEGERRSQCFFLNIDKARQHISILSKNQHPEDYGGYGYHEVYVYA